MVILFKEGVIVIMSNNDEDLLKRVRNMTDKQIVREFKRFEEAAKLAHIRPVGDLHTKLTPELPPYTVTFGDTSTYD